MRYEYGMNLCSVVYLIIIIIVQYARALLSIGLLSISASLCINDD